MCLGFMKSCKTYKNVISKITTIFHLKNLEDHFIELFQVENKSFHSSVDSI